MPAPNPVELVELIHRHEIQGEQQKGNVPWFDQRLQRDRFYFHWGRRRRHHWAALVLRAGGLYFVIMIQTLEDPVKKILQQVWRWPWFRVSIAQLVVTPLVIAAVATSIRWANLSWQMREAVRDHDKWIGFDTGVVVALVAAPACWLVGWVVDSFRHRSL